MTADPGNKPTNADALQPQPEISHDEKGNGISKGKRIVLFTIGAIIIVMLYFLLFNLSITETVEALPELPDLSLKNQTLTAELTRMSKSASILPLNGSNVGQLGEIYYANLFFEEAEICYNIARRLDKKNPRWPYFLAQIYQKKGIHKDVIHLIEQTIDMAPEYYPAILELADIHFKLGESRKAEEGYKQLVSKESVAPYAYLGLGRICIANGEWECAQDYLEKAIEMDRDFGVAHRLLATVHQHFGRMKEMRESQSIAEVYRFAEASDPWVDDLIFLCYDPTELIRQTDIAFKTHRMDRASRITERAVSLFSSNIEMYLKLGTNFRKHRMGPLIALGLFERALKLEPEHLEALEKAAECLILLRRPDEAEKYFRKILQISPSNDSALGNLGYIMYRKGRNDEALNLLRGSIAHHPQNTESLYNLGLLMMRLNRMEEATTFFRRVVSIDPNLHNAHYNLGFSLLRLGKADEAIPHLKDEIANNPKMLMAHGKLGQVYESLGRADEAVECYREVIRIAPDDAMGNFFLGRMLMENGKQKEAVAHLNKALTSSQESGNSALENQIRGILNRLNR